MLFSHKDLAAPPKDLFLSVLLDRSVPALLISAFKNARYHVVTTGETGLTSETDSTIFTRAGQSERVLVTHKKAFIDFKCFDYRVSSGVIILPAHDGNKDVGKAFVKAMAALNHISEKLPHLTGRDELSQKVIHYKPNGSFALFALPTPEAPRPRLAQEGVYYAPRP